MKIILKNHTRCLWISQLLNSDVKILTLNVIILGVVSLLDDQDIRTKLLKDISDTYCRELPCPLSCENWPLSDATRGSIGYFTESLINYEKNFLFFINQFVVFYNGLSGLICPNYSKLPTPMISLSMSIKKELSKSVKIGMIA